jgi:hypothetical protein
MGTVGVRRACRQDAPKPTDIARASWDVFEDVPRTSSDILVFSLQSSTSQDPARRVKLANENLHAALGQAGLGPDELAQIVQVDVRTVRRWLSGGTPYPRQRGKVARALDTTEHDLWPQIAAVPPPSPRATQASDLLAGYTTASDLAAPDWKALMRDASDRIDLLGDTLTPILATPGVPGLLAAKATHGCHVRILIHDTGPHVAPLLDQPGIDIRLLDAPADYNIHRYDEQLLLTLHVVGGDPDHAPLLHLRRAAPRGMFDRLSEYYDDLWERESHPLRPGVDAAPEEDEDESEIADTEPRLPASEHAATADGRPSAPRRWPRRPQGPDSSNPGPSQR